MIGDLHQLSPVVKDEDWLILKDYYPNLYFFSSKALEKTSPVSIELKHIYRQVDSQFIDLLNSVRKNDIDENVDLVKKALDGQRFIWNTRHKIVIRNHDVELYIQDFQEPHIASGLFSLLNNEWIKTPSYNPPSIDYRDVDKKFEGLVNDIQQIESLLNLSDFSTTTEQDLYHHTLSIKDKILKMRREGLARDGEFAIENLTFKKLRNEGYIEKIIDLISKAYTKIYNE